MAYPSKQLDATKNPRTRCTNCQTVFEVPRDLLTSADTRVRCGECLSIFDARSELRASDDEAGFGGGSSDPDLTSASHLTVDTDSLDVTYGGFDLFAEENDLPEIAYFDQTRDTPDFDFDVVEHDDDETFSETMFSHDVTIDADATRLRSKPALNTKVSASAFDELDFIEDEQDPEPVIFNYKDRQDVVEDDTDLDSDFPTEFASDGNAGGVEATATSRRFPKPKKPLLKPLSRASFKSPTTIVADTTRAPGESPSTPSFSSAPSKPSKPEIVDFVDDEEDFEELASSTRRVKLKVPKVPKLPKPSLPSVSGKWIFRLGMFALFCVLVLSLLMFRSKPQMYNSPTMRPVMAFGCKLVGCTVPARVDLSSLKMVKRNMYSHPNTANALVVNVSFRNTADFAQQLPLLHMVLSNRVGRVVARQDFVPPTYLRGWHKDAVIRPGQQMDVTLEVIDPGRDAQSFEFYFRQYNP